MSNIRVYDLSKELNVTNRRVIDEAKKIGITVKSHASSISEDEARRIKDAFYSSKTNGSAAAEEAAEEKVRVFHAETGEEVVERRKGSSVIIRRKKRVPVKEAPQPEPEEVSAQEEPVTAEEAAVVPEAAEAEQAEEPVVVEEPLEGESEDTARAEEQAVEPAPGAEPETEEETPHPAPAIGTEAEKKGEKAAPEHPRKKKAKKVVKPKKEEIIDEETLDELRKAFKTKLPAKKREYLVEEKKSRQRLSGDSARIDKQLFKSTQEPGAELFGIPADAAEASQIPAKTEKKVVKIGESINVGELAKRMSIKGILLVRKLISSGMRVTLNQSIDFETAAIIAGDLGFEVVADYFEEDLLLEDNGVETEALPRPPVVTVMGHVDHGKTTLLDSIRKSSVVEGEAGGITQHIGAYSVDIGDKKIVFIDTPGHEAFTSMRARGAKVTDIVILVVAADDGVMPQTVEAYNHAKAAGVPVVVALNKIDKPGADREKVLRELTEIELVPEEWGGDTMLCDVSAKESTGISELLEAVLLQSEVLELKGHPSARAHGIVIESRLDKGRGPVATVIVQDGTLHAGDYLVSGLAWGKVRVLIDDKGVKLEEAGPSMPAEIVGLSAVPEAGQPFNVVKNEKTAKEIIQHRANKHREKIAASTRKVTLKNLFDTLKEGELKELPLIIKGDTHGSVEALADSIEGIESEKCRVKIIHSAVGAINETDVTLASASNAIIVGFNVRPDPKALALAEKEGVSLELHEIIYNAIDRVKNAMVGLLEPIQNEKILGHAEVRDTFHISKVGMIAGCYVLDGTVTRGDSVRVVRDGVKVYEGKLSSLKRFKDDAREVQTGFECGIGVENFNDIKVGDVLELFTYEEITPEL